MLGFLLIQIIMLKLLLCLLLLQYIDSFKSSFLDSSRNWINLRNGYSRSKSILSPISNIKELNSIVLLHANMMISNTIANNDIQVTSNEGSVGVEVLIKYLNSDKATILMNKLALSNQTLANEAEKLNFWTGGNFIIQNTTCTGIVPQGLRLQVDCLIKNKKQIRDVIANFPDNMMIRNEVMLKNALVQMATKLGRIQDTGSIMILPFGQDVSMPIDFKFNNVPHSTWVRSYLYDAATNAVVNAIEDPLLIDKSRLQLKVNFPEVNPAFDTYRIGTLLELVRHATLKLTEMKGLRVRICVQQSLGEGIFTGLPLALSSMRPVLESMDWGQQLNPEDKFNKQDNISPRKEALIRLGTIGADQVAEDDDVFIIICPQNVIGGMIINSLEEMVKAANGRPLILINPNLADKPSSNNMMQIRGRSERRDFANSFKDIYALRLLYPSNGGYMFPIRGMIAKKDYHSPWVAYSKEDVPTTTSSTDVSSTSSKNIKEIYRIIAAFDPYQPPDPNLLSSVFGNSESK